ncbi:MAG: DUF6364 family protein [Actinomycetota bacterium]
MKTTLNLDDSLLERAKRHAADRGTTLTAVVEDALRVALDDVGSDPSYRLEVPVVQGERPPTVDPADRDALYDLMDRPASP